ncbi:hypothetical protein WJX72_010017 [[Myrmecia] bisecta]|uniref:SAM domain-containing protein n=1 Tax=[Myrmecia] bisecta TaxID=41462 RepID=A0AAW1QG75_9CHLO
MLQGHRVAEWVKHGIGLPQYMQAFRANSITALDFPLLVMDGGRTLENELGVTSKLHRQQIMRAVKRIMLGLGQAPGPAQSVQCRALSCDSIGVSWQAPAQLGHPPMHKYKLERQQVEGLEERIAMPQWVTANGDVDDEDSYFLDGGLEVGKYQYRLSAWNAYGWSPYAVTGVCSTVNSTLPCPSAKNCVLLANCRATVVDRFAAYDESPTSAAAGSAVHQRSKLLPDAGDLAPHRHPWLHHVARAGLWVAFGIVSMACATAILLAVLLQPRIFDKLHLHLQRLRQPPHAHDKLLEAPMPAHLPDQQLTHWASSQALLDDASRDPAAVVVEQRGVLRSRSARSTSELAAHHSGEARLPAPLHSKSMPGRPERVAQLVHTDSNRSSRTDPEIMPNGVADWLDYDAPESSANGHQDLAGTAEDATHPMESEHHVSRNHELPRSTQEQLDKTNKLVRKPSNHGSTGDLKGLAAVSKTQGHGAAATHRLTSSSSNRSIVGSDETRAAAMHRWHIAQTGVHAMLRFKQAGQELQLRRASQQQ